MQVPIILFNYFENPLGRATGAKTMKRLTENYSSLSLKERSDWHTLFMAKVESIPR